MEQSAGNDRPCHSLRRLYQLHQTQSGMQPPSINSAVSALRFFFTVTLDRPDLARRLTVVPQPRRIPVVLDITDQSSIKPSAALAGPGPQSSEAFCSHPLCKTIPRQRRGATNSPQTANCSPLSRGFVLRRLSDAGRRPLPGSTAHAAPASETLTGSGRSQDHAGINPQRAFGACAGRALGSAAAAIRICHLGARARRNLVIGTLACYPPKCRWLELTFTDREDVRVGSILDIRQFKGQGW